MRWYSLVTLRACLREVTREEDGTMAMDFRIKTKGKGKMEPMRATKPRRLLLPMCCCQCSEFLSDNVLH